MTEIFYIFFQIPYRYISLGLSDDKSALVQAMASGSQSMLFHHQDMHWFLRRCAFAIQHLWSCFQCIPWFKDPILKMSSVNPGLDAARQQTITWTNDDQDTHHLTSSLGLNEFTMQGFPITKLSLQWCHNERDGASNHQPHDCLLNRLPRHRSKITPKLRVTGTAFVWGIHQ